MGESIPKWIINAICAERERQKTIWSEDFDSRNTPNDWICFLIMYAGRGSKYPWDPGAFKTAMIKVAALACAALEWWDRTNGKMAKRHYDV
jgi:hypothetical protein